MALYRTIHTKFWQDAKVNENMSIEDRYLFLYILTNQNSNQLGCYEISKKLISYETDLTYKEIDEIIKNLEENLKIIKFDATTNEFFIENWHKFNWTRSPKVKDCILKELQNVKSLKFKEILNNLIKKIYSIDTLSIPYTYPMDTQSQEKEKEKEKEKEYKKKKLLVKTNTDLVAEPPTTTTIIFPFFNEVVSYGVEELGLEESYCERFYDYYDAVGWKKKNGQEITNWKAMLKTWVDGDKKKEEENPKRRYL